MDQGSATHYPDASNSRRPSKPTYPGNTLWREVEERLPKRPHPKSKEGSEALKSTVIDESKRESIEGHWHRCEWWLTTFGFIGQKGGFCIALLIGLRCSS